MKPAGSAVLHIFLALAALQLCRCAGAPPQQSTPQPFEPRLKFVRAEAGHVFALGALDDAGGLVVYLAHREPIVRYLAHESLLTALHYGHRASSPPNYEPFRGDERARKDYRKWLAWLTSEVNLKGIVRSTPRPRKKESEERRLLEAALAAARHSGRARDIDLLIEMIDTDDDYVKGTAARFLKKLVGGPPQDQAHGVQAAEMWRKWWQVERAAMPAGR